MGGSFGYRRRSFVTFSFSAFFFFQPDALADSDKEKMTTKTTIFSIITRIDLLNFIMSTERPQ